MTVEEKMSGSIDCYLKDKILNSEKVYKISSQTSIDAFYLLHAILHPLEASIAFPKELTDKF